MIDLLPCRWTSSQLPLLFRYILRSVAMRKNRSPSGERITNGSRSPFSPVVEVSTGCPSLSSRQLNALSPRLRA